MKRKKPDPRLVAANPICYRIPGNIEALTRQNGLTDKDVEDYMGFSHSTWMCRKRTPTDIKAGELEALCSLFGVTMGQLTGANELREDEIPVSESRRAKGRARDEGQHGREGA